MAATDKQVALRKRQQIENAGRMMFIWVAIAAALVGTVGVVGVSLFNRMVFNQKILAEKNTTADTLKKNNQIVDTLKENVRVINTDQNLVKTPHAQDAEPISVVLDALPATANSEAFGASLQEKLLNIDGVSLESLSPIAGEAVSTQPDVSEIAFRFSVSVASGNATALKKVLSNLEDSIRPVSVRKVSIEQQNNKIAMSVEVSTYYLPETTVQLNKKAVKP
ncbi:hypothetical protein KBD87_04310 [Candidatus Saccharibacteria bacterium]|jgi:hypothetical protein|nr:hypothetical protein [Candidatus Saccharibacteria bacterium]